MLEHSDAGGLAVPESFPTISVDDLVQQFLEHAANARGLSIATRRGQGRYVREFLRPICPAEAVDFGGITARNLVDFVVKRAESGRTGSTREAASTLRGFLRFLVQQGLCTEELVNAVPAMAHRSAYLPCSLSGDQLTRLLASFDRSHASGCRDYAMTLCMARLGLRVSEVVGVQLEDIAWRAGTLRIAPGKTRRTDTLPLLSDVGHAIAEYIRDFRPRTSDRHIFVTHKTPRGRPLNRSSARGAIRRAFDRAGLEVASKGTHVLRRTLATTMVCQGASLKEVADVLRHRNLDTTAVYARVDLPTLRSVAMPWPEVR
jgi:integrase/recombinase XerD